MSNINALIAAAVGAYSSLAGFNLLPLPVPGEDERAKVQKLLRILGPVLFVGGLAITSGLVSADSFKHRRVSSEHTKVKSAAADWKRFIPKNGDFIIRVPAEATETSSSGVSAGEPYVAIQIKGETASGIRFSATQLSRRTSSPNIELDNILLAAEQSASDQIERSKLHVDGHPALELKLRSGTTIRWSRTIVVPGSLYQTNVEYPAKREKEGHLIGAKFFDSLSFESKATIHELPADLNDMPERGSSVPTHARAGMTRNQEGERNS